MEVLELTGEGMAFCSITVYFQGPHMLLAFTVVVSFGRGECMVVVRDRQIRLGSFV